MAYNLNATPHFYGGLVELGNTNSKNKLSFFMRLASKLDSPSSPRSRSGAASPADDALAKGIASAEQALRSPQPSVYEQLNGAAANSRELTLSAAQAAWDAEKKRGSGAGAAAGMGASGSNGSVAHGSAADGQGGARSGKGNGGGSGKSSSASSTANTSTSSNNVDAAVATLAAAQEAWAAEKQRLRAVDQGGPNKSAPVRSLQFARQAGGRVSKAKQVATPIIFE